MSLRCGRELAIDNRHSVINLTPLSARATIHPDQIRFESETPFGLMALGTAESIIDLIGHTPLLHLARFAPPPLASVYAKIEWLNPGGSVKDRAALGMILDAERKGLLRPGATIIEPTAGNTGIGLALVGIAKGYRVVLCVPRGFAVEKMKLIEVLGGEIEYVPQESGMKGAIERCHELAKQIEGSFVPQQFACFQIKAKQFQSIATVCSNAVGMTIFLAFANMPHRLSPGYDRAFD